MEKDKIRNILLKLQFNISCKGFDYWIQAIHIYTTFIEKITMKELYRELAFEFVTTEGSIERTMRTASKTAIENIKQHFDYNGKITNKSILNLFRKYMEE